MTTYKDSKMVTRTSSEQTQQTLHLQPGDIARDGLGNIWEFRNLSIKGASIEPVRRITGKLITLGNNDFSTYPRDELPAVLPPSSIDIGWVRDFDIDGKYSAGSVGYNQHIDIQEVLTPLTHPEEFI